MFPLASGGGLECIRSTLLGWLVMSAAAECDIDTTDRRIDRLVYKLYKLTDEEIAIVEEATG